jgi:hypothetical protein
MADPGQAWERKGRRLSMGLFDRFKKSAPVDLTAEVKCPKCAHGFVPPRVLLVTQAVVDRFGPNPVQCPECKHIWSRGK